MKAERNRVRKRRSTSCIYTALKSGYLVKVKVRKEEIGKIKECWVDSKNGCVSSSGSKIL